MGLRDRLHDVRAMRTLFTAAEAHAHDMGEQAPGPEHLLLAALDLPDGSARRAFARVGIDADGFRTALVAQHADALRTVGLDAPDATLDDRLPPPPARPPGPLRTTGGAQTLFADVVDRVRAERSRLHSAWIVLAAAGIEHGSVPRTLGRMGVDRGALRDAARAEIDGARR